MSFSLPSNEDGVPVIRREVLQDYLGIDRVNRAMERLAHLKKPGRYIFEINTASHTFPFIPERIRLKRNVLTHSTQNGQRQGSSYNNFSLVTLFAADERNHASIDDFLETEDINRRELVQEARRFLHHFSLDGVPHDVLSWSSYQGLDFHGKLSRFEMKNELKGLFAAAVRKHDWFIDRDQGLVALGDLPVASSAEIRRSLDKIFVAMNMAEYDEQGVLVPSLLRAILIYTWILGTLFFTTYGVAVGWSDYPLWSKSYFEVIVFVSISVPALVQYITGEPSIIRHALRASRMLIKNSQVQKYFNLTKFDYAVMGLENTRMWLVSHQTDSYLLQGGHPALRGDMCVTDTDSLERVGFYVGTSMARREWDDDNVRVSNNSDGSVSILPEKSRVYYAISHDYNREVR